VPLPFELGTGAWDQKTRMMGLPGRQRSLTITSANVMDGGTDGETPGHSKDRTYACGIASRGKNQLSLTNRATHFCICANALAYLFT